MPEWFATIHHTLQEFLIEFDAQARFFRHDHVTLLDYALIGEYDVVPSRVVESVELQSQEVGYAGADVCVAYGGQGAGIVVWGEGDIVGLGEVGDLAALG